MPILLLKKQNMNFKITGINHFGLSVGDLEESISFYTNVLGIPYSEKREHDCFFPVGESSVFALIQYPGGKKAFEKEMRPKHKGKAFTHFGFEAPSIKDVFALQEKLVSLNIEITKKAYERWDGASVYFTDPNGYTLEFIYFDADTHEK
jgi:catechol 2,3-dioxygenase-like lactoylglutathione lyase family enzyme